MEYGITTVRDDALYASYSTQQGIPLGQLAAALSGKGLYRWALMGAVNGVAGNVFQSEVPLANHDDVTADVARAIGARQVSATLGATAASKDDYKEGYVLISDDAGEGVAYPVGAHEAANASAVLTVNLGSDVEVAVALTTATTMSFVKNRYKDIIIHPSPPTARVVGVPNFAITAAEYGWVQVAGPCAVLTDGTLVIFEDVVASDTVNGAVEPADAAITDGTPPTGHGEPHLGNVMSVSATTEYSLVDLTIG